MKLEQKVDLILEGMFELKGDVKELKEDMHELKKDVTELKGRVSCLEEDMQE